MQLEFTKDPSINAIKTDSKVSRSYGQLNSLFIQIQSYKKSGSYCYYQAVYYFCKGIKHML